MHRPFFLLLILTLVLVLGLEMTDKVLVRRAGQPGQPNPDKVVVEKPKFPDRVGEKITYDVLMGAIRVGSAVFNYQAKPGLNNKPANLFTFQTRMLRFKDNEAIYSDPETYLPLRVEREISAWPKYEKITEVYDQDNFTLNIVKVESNKEQASSFRKSSAIHNSILLPYMVRRLPELAVGWSFQANLPTQQFKIELANIEQVKVAAGEFKAYHFKSSPERFEIWVSADEYKIPLKIKGMSGIGYTLEMREYSPGGKALGGNR